MTIRNCPSCGCRKLYWDDEKEEILNSHYDQRAPFTCRVCDCSHPELHDSEMAITNHPPTWPGYIDNRRN